MIMNVKTFNDYVQLTRTNIARERAMGNPHIKHDYFIHDMELENPYGFSLDNYFFKPSGNDKYRVVCDDPLKFVSVDGKFFIKKSDIICIVTEKGDA